jgi:type IV pilus assembly protein PilE
MKGFTLLEVLVTVAIIGILASVAIPSYSELTARAKVTDALLMLASTGKSMQLSFQENGNYTCKQPSWNTKYFNYVCSASNNSFTIIATGLDNVSNYSYSLNSEGTHKTLASPSGASNSCWRLSGKEC